MTTTASEGRSGQGFVIASGAKQIQESRAQPTSCAPSLTVCISNGLVWPWSFGSLAMTRFHSTLFLV
jgi:hypothetical protein